MSQETELKLSLRASDLPRLLAHPLLNAAPPLRQRLFNTYFDTPTLALQQQRIAVRERRIGRRTLLTVKTAGQSVGGLSQRGEWEAPTRPGAFGFATLVDDRALAESLTRLAWQLVPVFRTDFTRRAWQLQHRGAHIELALDQGAITTGHSALNPGGTLSEPILELELELKSGPVDALLDLAQTLALGPEGQAASGIGLLPADRSKAQRGLALFRGEHPVPTKATAVALAATQHPLAAFQAAALGSLAHLQANTAGLLQTPTGAGLPDPEFVHQARVALRRLRTSLRLFAPFLPARFAAHWNTRWRALAHTLGQARDRDVLATQTLPGLLAGATCPPELAAWLHSQRQTAHAQVQAQLAAPAHALDLLGFTRALLALSPPAAARRQRTLAHWAENALRQRHQRLLQQTRRGLRQGPDSRHALRIELKQLRYAQDNLASLLPPDRLRRSSALLARAQDVLGRLNDLDTAQTLLTNAPDGLAPATLHERLQAQLAQDLVPLPRLERELLRAPTPWG